MAQAMEFLRKAKNKVLEVAFGASGEEFKIHQQTLSKLEVQINALKSNVTHYSRAMISLSAAACSAASEVGKFYADSKARAKSIKLFTDCNFKMEAISEELFKDQYARDILKPLDDWVEEIKGVKKLIQQAIQVSEQVHQQAEKVKGLSSAKDKKGAKGQSLSNKEEQTNEQEEQRLEKYSKLYTQMKATIDKNVKALVEGRYARFDACFVRLMECQVEFYRHGVSQTENFLPNIDNYRRRFPRKTPSVSVENGTISPPTSQSGPSLVVDSVDSSFPDLSSPTASAASDNDSGAQPDWEGLKTEQKKETQVNEAAKQRREERKKEAEAEAARSAALKAEGGGDLDDGFPLTRDFLNFPVPPTPPSSGRGVKEPARKSTSDTEESPAPTKPRPPVLNIFEQVDYTEPEGVPSVPSLASPKSPMSPMIPSIDNIFVTSDLDGNTAELDLFNMENTTSTQKPVGGKKNDGIVPPTPPPSARGQRKGPGLDISELKNQLSVLQVSSPTTVPPTPPPSARGTKPPLSTLNMDVLTSQLDRLAGADAGEESDTGNGGGSGGITRQDRSASFDIEGLMERFNPLVHSASEEDDILGSYVSPPSSNRSTGPPSSARGGSTGLPSVLENFDPFTDEPTVGSSPTKKKSESSSSGYSAPDPGLASEIDDELPKPKQTGKTSAVENFRNSENAKLEAQEAKRQVGGTLEIKLNAWEFKDGTQKNIRTLLTTLDTLLWEGSGWKKPSLTELTDVEGVRKVVRKARLVVHPDKVQTGTTEQQVIAERVFETLNTAFQQWEQNPK